MPRIRLEPIEQELEVDAGETILDAAFRHGLNLVYGCREGQCSACKCFVLEGDTELKPYSSFALSDTERANGYSLMCRAMPVRDITVELLHYDRDALALEHPIEDRVASVEAVEELTRDIVRLVLRADGFDFTPGQYVDLHVPGTDGIKRSFSMANLPGEDRIELIIKRYPGGRFSGLLGGGLAAGDSLGFTGPYGSLRVHESQRPILMIAGGSGMAPILSLLRALARDGCTRPVRFFYGARAPEDLFGGEQIESLGTRLADFRFIPVVGGFVHEAIDEELADPDVYMCGPPPMVEAAEAMLAARGVPEDRVFVDKFTTSADAVVAEAPAPAVVSERDFIWFAPAGRRASVYEDVTVDTQPSVRRHLQRGWPVSFEDGRGTWEEASTAVRSSDWFAFRDPGQQWERTYYQAGAAVERGIEGAMRHAAQDGLIADFSTEWVAFLRRYLQVPAYVEHGLWFALATIGRDCLSDTVATCVCLQAAMKQRSAQAIVLYAMDLEQHHGPFPIEDARATFLEEASWQPTRRYLEALAATRDWGEVIVAANVCFEPIVGTLLRRELGIRAAARAGDTLTPVLARGAAQEWAWAKAWTDEFVRFLVEDPVHGEHNRATIDAWVQTWRPQAVAAARALPVDVEVPAAEPPAASVANPASPRRRTRPPRPRARAAAAVSDGEAGDGHDLVGIVMAKSAEGDAVAEVLRSREGVEVLEQPSFWDIRARGRLTIAYDEVSEALGYEIDAYSMQHEMSTHYGRLIATNDALMLFSDPTEAMEHLLA